MPLRRISLMALLTMGVLALVAPSTRAQVDDYPDRTVTIVAPAAPGGLYSLFARLIGSKLEARLGKTFIVENRPGASSIVGAVSVARATPDGYTLMVANSTGMATNVTIHKSLPYDPTSDLAPVMLIARIPEVLVVNAALGVRTIADLSKLAKSTPGGLSFGSAGAGTAQHLDGSMLKNILGIEMTHVPYKGMSPAINDVAGGHIPMMFSPIPLALPLIQSGKVIPLGVTTRTRVDPIRDVPALAEIGVPGYDASSWFMLVAPGKTPKAIVDKLYAALQGFSADADTRQQFVALGLMPIDSPPPEELKAFVKSEIARWAAIVTAAGLAKSQ
jgi:tripartite-type tricarboxylate transporter receptor subunit TctC